MSKKTVVIIASTFIGLLILLIFVLWILSITKHKYYTYQEVEQKMIEAAKTFYKENPEILPVNDGRSTLSYGTLVEKNLIKPLNELLKDGDSCSADISVIKNDNNYSYIPRLSCSDKYVTIELSEQIIKNNPVVTSGSGLYRDNKGGYYFRGKIDNNFVYFGKTGEGKKAEPMLWKIMEIDSSSRIKLIATNPLAKKQVYDTRYNEGQKRNYGYNDFELSALKETLVAAENDESFLTKSQKALLSKSRLCVGSRSVLDESKDGSSECSKLSNDSYMFGLMYPYEYIRASIDDNCKNMYDLSCQNLNYLVTKSTYTKWTLTKVPNSDFELYTFNGITFSEERASRSEAVFPTIYLDSFTMFKSGDGSYNNPYIVE